MIQVQGTIKLNYNDTVLSSNPVITVEADFKYPGWATEITASFPMSSGDFQTNAIKKYRIDGMILTQYDTGDGLFATRLGTILENFVADDLKQINPEATITVI